MFIGKISSVGFGSKRRVQKIDLTVELDGAVDRALARQRRRDSHTCLLAWRRSKQEWIDAQSALVSANKQLSLISYSSIRSPLGAVVWSCRDAQLLPHWKAGELQRRFASQVSSLKRVSNCPVLACPFQYAAVVALYRAYGRALWTKLSSARANTNGIQRRTEDTSGPVPNLDLPLYMLANVAVGEKLPMWGFWAMEAGERAAAARR